MSTRTAFVGEGTNDVIPDDSHEGSAELGMEQRSSATLMAQPASRPQVRSGLDSPDQTVASRDGQVATSERARTVRTVFPQPDDGYAAVGQLRAVGFRIDLAGSIAGDLIVSIQAGRARFDELAAIVAAHHGRIETQPEGSARQRRDSGDTSDTPATER